MDDQERIVQEFCQNTGAAEHVARKVLSRNSWNMARSYKEVEQMCLYRHQPESCRTSIAIPCQGGTEGGIGPAVSLDSRGVRPPIRQYAGDSLVQVHPVQGLRVALPPPATVAAERIIPIQVEGGQMIYPAQVVSQSNAKHTESLSAAMNRPTDEVLPTQSRMIPASMLTQNNASNNVLKSSLSECSTPVDYQQQVNPSASNSASSFSESGYPRLKRGFSNIIENESIVSAARTSVLHNIKEDNNQQMFSTFVLPDLDSYSHDFSEFLKKELIESSTLNSLQTAGRLNWWAEQGLCHRLVPMATTGDGNCLLHAASLAMWGIHDRQLTLRNVLHHTLTKADYKLNLFRRWRWQQTLTNQQSGLVFSEQEWTAEWENILRLASPAPRNGPDHSYSSTHSCCDSMVTHSSSGTSDPLVYESLEEFHVFVLAHVLKRPIIVVADTILRDANGDALAPIPFGGIYLPLECHSQECCLSPLLLTYDAAHFSALVPMQHCGQELVPWAIPVVDPQLRLLPLHFCYDPGADFNWSSLNNQIASLLEPCQEDCLNLLKRYMDVMQLPYCPDPQQSLHNRPADRQHSSGSDDGSSMNSGTLKRDKKGSSVAKQFGSLSKSVGKKLKNLGNNLAPSRPGKGGVDSGLSQSAKVITAVATTAGGEKEEWVYCARLVLDHGPDSARQQFIENYLKDAHRRFQDKEQKRPQKGEEPRQWPCGPPPPYSSLVPNHKCRTPGCEYSAMPELSLCDRCAGQQTWGTLASRGGGYGQHQTLGYHTFPGRHKAPTGLPPGPASSGTSDEIYRYGKSKFYTHLDEPTSLPVARHHPSNTLQFLKDSDRQTSLSAGNVARPRSPSPDYDNMRHSAEASKKCITESCSFFGSQSTGGLCSGCYRNNPYPPQLAKPEKTTRL